MRIAFDIDLPAIAEKAFRLVTSPLVEDDDAVPFSTLATFAALAVIPSLRRGECKTHDPGTGLPMTDFRVFTKVTDENDFIHRTGREGLLAKTVIL